MKNNKLLLKVSVLTSILLLAACGQKGPLYLEEKSTKETVNTSEQDVLNSQETESSTENSTTDY